jgi:hypothetical protein
VYDAFWHSILPVANADDRISETVVRFNAPVETSGIHITGWALLPAGTYVIQHSGLTVRTPDLWREAGGPPEALRARFYPGHNWEEFVYPEPQALDLPKRPTRSFSTRRADITRGATTPIARWSQWSWD